MESFSFHASFNKETYPMTLDSASSQDFAEMWHCVFNLNRSIAHTATSLFGWWFSTNYCFTCLPTVIWREGFSAFPPQQTRSPPLLLLGDDHPQSHKDRKRENCWLGGDHVTFGILNYYHCKPLLVYQVKITNVCYSFSTLTEQVTV